MNWQGKKVAVTGAGGFIASHLVETLVRQGAQVRALVRYTSRSDNGWLDDVRRNLGTEFEIVRGDIRESQGIMRVVEGCDYVFHLAALIAIPYSYDWPGSYIETNVVGGFNVLEAARAQRVSKVIFTSTSEVYGSALYTPMDETHPLQTQSPYAASKAASDLLAASYARSFEMPVVVVRPFNTYGPRQSRRAVIPTIISQALVGTEIYLGDTTPVRDLNFVADTVAGFLACAANAVADGRVYNLASGVGVSIGEVVERIGRLLGKPLTIVSDPRRRRPEASEVRCLIGASKRVEAECGWKPTFSLDEGLRQTVSWFAQHPEIRSAATESVREYVK
ncbi:MAG TPA: GDP-mannose 4,6-dehydratase [Candidatus Ozemobacteraceae bacterium]|nr:GDP-mannose 4,6-dehydratase [Candidatus Ozemobacteraceae bacterium]